MITLGWELKSNKDKENEIKKNASVYNGLRKYREILRSSYPACLTHNAYIQCVATALTNEGET